MPYHGKIGACCHFCMRLEENWCLFPLLKLLAILLSTTALFFPGQNIMLLYMIFILWNLLQISG
uniref:Uncharacterized protein n=1 Tax=Rhizophora mucronata TaxID=61149 RepID=A0A2P2R2C9_RHIMU